jgi:hypothetical protein
MNCTQCGDKITAGHAYIAVFETPKGLRLEEGCVHRVPEGVEEALATLNSISCMQRWIGTWMAQQNCSKHG